MSVVALGTAVGLGAEAWVIGKARGTVLALVGDKWVEVGPRTMIPLGTPVRTLQRGSVELVGEGGTITLGSMSAMSVDRDGGRLVLTQHAGSFRLDAQMPAGLLIRTETAAISVGAGRTVLELSSSGAVAVEQGAATVVVSGSPDFVAVAGDTVTVSGAATPGAAATMQIGQPATPAPADGADARAGGIVSAGDSGATSISGTTLSGGSGAAVDGGVDGIANSVTTGGSANSNGNAGGNGNGNAGGNSSGNNGKGNGAGNGGQGNGAGGGAGNNGNGNGNGNGAGQNE